MKQLECKLVFIKAKAETIRARGIVPGWDQQFMLEYAKKFGGNPEEIHQHFVWEQQKMEELADKSSLENFIDAEGDFSQNVDDVYRFWVE